MVLIAPIVTTAQLLTLQCPYLTILQSKVEATMVQLVDLSIMVTIQTALTQLTINLKIIM
jgi:hypothetical protein